MTAIPEIPFGAIENGRVLLERLADHYDFTCDAGSLSNCTDYMDAVACFNFIAEWASELTAALPFLQGVKVKALEWTKGVVDIAHPHPGMKYVACSTTPKGSWAWWLDNAPETRDVFSSEEAAKAAAQSAYEARILSALEPFANSYPQGANLAAHSKNENGPDHEPSPRAQALEEGDLQELLERLDAGLEYEGDLETENNHVELFNTEAALELFANAAAAIRALSSQPVADKPWYLVMPERDPFAAGFEARQDDVDENNNPFNYGTDNAGDWNAGWESADYEIAQSTDQPVADHSSDVRNMVADGRNGLERFWRPISEADKAITFEDTFDLGEGKTMTIRNSDKYWVRDADGRIFEATWSDHKDGYWWDIEGESPVDPVEYMPHPLSSAEGGK